VIAFESLVVRYPRARADALAGVSFEAQRGRMTAVVGPNGSGKSTLVRALLGRVPPVAGHVRVDGTDVATLDRRRLAQRVAVVPQREEPSFPLPVRQYVALARYPHRGAWQSSTAADVHAVQRAVRLTDVEPFLDRSTDELSGGEWQRVRLARALAQGGEALVLDEPTTFLDTAHEMAIFELLDALAGAGIAVLLVSHQVNLVARFADVMVLLHRGRVAAAGAPADVMRAPVLEQVYEWPLVVTRDPAIGAPALVPLRGGRRTDLT
jgi:ABC-type cobalamin/Fe3+-siderophores transport system ATPase subunit